MATLLHSLAPGTPLDRYDVLSVLGKGGMATVVEVRHRDLGTRHALKVLSIDMPGLRERMLFEGRAQASLSHPNVCRVSDVIRVDGAIGLVMDLVRGPTLEQLLAALQPNLLQIDLLADGTLEGIRAAHAAGLIHRDLKTSNVLIDVVEGRIVPKVADFGLARALDNTNGGRDTRSGMNMGTPAFMAPEQFRDAKSADQRADIFSTGCVLYELATGVPAFFGETAFSYYEATSAGAFRRVADVSPTVPLRMQRAIERALAPEPDARWQTIAELRAAWFEGAPPVNPDAFEPSHVALITAQVRPVDHGTGTAPAAPSPEPRSNTLVPDRPQEPSPEPAPSRLLPPSASTTSNAPLANSPALVGAGAVIGGALVALAIGAVLLGGSVAWYVTRPPEPPRALVAQPAPPPPPAPEPPPPAPTAVVPEPAPPPPSPAPESAPVRPKVEPPSPSVVADPVRTPADKARVEVTGVTASVWLVNAAGDRVRPGQVAPGTWSVQVFFDDAKATRVMDVTLAAGDHRIISCDASLKQCR